MLTNWAVGEGGGVYEGSRKMKCALICTEQVFIGHKTGPSPRKA